MENFKKINIGILVRQRVKECEVETDRICNFLKCSEKEIEEMYKASSLDSHLLLRWSKLLNYDFFRIYSQHLILYSPPERAGVHQKPDHLRQAYALPEFRKNIYTVEVIDFILELIKTGKKTKLQVIHDYKIPKTTLYKWISKYAED